MEGGGGFSGAVVVVPYSPAVRAKSLADEFELEKRFFRKQDEIFAKSQRFDLCRRFSLSDDDEEDDDPSHHHRTHDPALKRSISMSLPVTDNGVDPRRRSRRNGDVNEEEETRAERKVGQEKPFGPGLMAHPVRSARETYFSTLEAKAEQIKKFFSGTFWRTSNEDKQPGAISGPTEPKPRPALRRTFSFRARSGDLSEIFEKSSFDKSSTLGKSATFPAPTRASIA